jgi:divalent metal cation (Fe/Co/Zn/Cd) transporter
VFVESVERLLDPNLELAVITTQGLIVMLITIVVKGLAWLWCRNFKSSSIQGWKSASAPRIVISSETDRNPAALAQDAENDAVFNIFSLIFPYGGSLLNTKYLDPIGGLVLSLYSASLTGL